MAKKRKKEKEQKEDYEFRPPEFDEKQFLKKEISDTRTALLTIVYGVAFGIIAGLITVFAPGLAAAAFLVGIAGMVLLKYLYPLMKVDITGLKKKNWLGNLGTYFFTFLAIWVLLLNVPFSDHANPTVEKVIVWVDRGTYVRGVELTQEGTVWALAEGDPNDTATVDTIVSKAANVTLNITAKVADNGKLVSVKMAISTADSPFHDMTYEGDGRYGFEILSGSLTTEDDLMFYIEAEDEEGNSFAYHPEAELTVAP